MRVMGLDTSSRTGLAIIECGKKIIHTEEIAPKNFKGMERCGAIAGGVLHNIEEHKVDFVVIENYGFANSHTLVPLVEIGTVLRYFLYQADIPFILAPPNSLKKFITGAGNAKKDSILLHVYKRWGVEAKTDNIADAIGLAMFGLACVGEYFPVTYMQAVVAVRKGQEDVFVELKKRGFECT